VEFITPRGVNYFQPLGLKGGDVFATASDGSAQSGLEKALSLLFDAFSSREPVSTSLENALAF
jgi:hypothetical protein